MTRPTGSVAVLPNHIKLGWRPAGIPLDNLIWPLGQPDHLRGRHLRDLSSEDHLVVFPRKTLHARLGWGTRARISIMILEPAAIHGTHMKLLRTTWRRFHKVLSCDHALLNAIPNGVFFPFGSTWVPEWRDLDTTKTRMCSLIASAKRSQTGHVLRHSVAQKITADKMAVDLMGGGYAPFDAKSDGLAPYRYSVVIENVAEPNYFTEKLIDAILCDTIPIYWGCPNISEFLATDSMIICKSEAEIITALQAMSDEDYQARIPALHAIKDQAADYGDIYGRAARAVLGQMP